MQISLVEFSVGNYKIFRDKVTFSMAARKNERHTFESNSEHLLKTSLIYGPNASGKSSLLEAFGLMRMGIFTSANIQESQSLPHKPFLAFAHTELTPTFFEVVFSIEGDYPGVYRYSFSFVQDRIISEQLVKILASGGEERLVLRDEQNIEIGGIFDTEKALIERTRKEALFLSTAALNNSPFALYLIDAFRAVNVISGVRPKYQNFTIKKFKENKKYREQILQYLKIADFCIIDGVTEEVDVQRVDIKDDDKGFSANKRTEKENVLFLSHPVYDSSKKITADFRLQLEEESMGTQRFLAVLGPIVDTLAEGKVLFVDEFDNSLHPLLTKFIIELFESREINQKNAQLIVTTHDTSLLSYKDELIKDQFWFTEKDDFGAAKLFSLAEFELRNDTEFSKKYLEGRFGALPIIGGVHN